jgi:putative nucleotidyltransferase with HDIG domain
VGLQLPSEWIVVNAASRFSDWASAAQRAYDLPYNDLGRYTIVDTAHILVVDDEEAIREVVLTMLESRGYKCTALGNGRDAQEFIRKQAPDLILLDLILPEIDGIQLLDWLRSFNREIPVIMLSGIHDISTALDVMRRGAYDYILKPFEKDQLFHAVGRAWQHRQLVTEDKNYRLNLQQEVERKTAELTNALDLLTQAYDDTLETLGSALDVKDAETADHSRRVTAYTISIAKSVPVPLPYLTVLARAAFLHDIGKMAIPDKILRKPGPLDDAEKVIMRTHCEIGYNMLTRIPFLRDAADIVLAHHEFFDGTGYPRGLRGEQIPLGARIMFIANALDSMLSDCPYRNALPMSRAREEIRRCAGTQFDPKIVEVFLSIPESHWIELRENLGSPFRLTHLRNMGLVPN